MYKKSYDQRNRFLSVSSDPRHPVRPFQKGFREYLLCLQCERKFQKYEVYVTNILREIDKIPLNEKKMIKYDGYEYHKIKLFALSIIWRAHESTLHGFRKINLSPHAEKIRKMLLNSDPGEPKKYAVIISKFNAGIPAERTLVPFVKFRFFGLHTYKIEALGYLWFIVVSTQAQELKLEPGIIGTSSSLIIPIIDINEKEYIENMRKQVSKMGKLKKK